MNVEISPCIKALLPEISFSYTLRWDTNVIELTLNVKAVHTHITKGLYKYDKYN